ncbi:hypothetical protein AMS68_002660 [Peltaster fructicola]|uniref:Pre-mRNA-splicing factor n=1 Tax=Peltaster fructicola TaxID=286661 RepID=A0A6H0XR12_9PEZI|nr:hypothetical protein AMS68_002660 [Peltaster fructicola]
MADTQAPPKFSISIGGVKKTSSPANPLKRSHASLFEEEEEEGQNKKVHTVTHFDRKAGGAIDENQPRSKGPLIIKPLSNRSWKEAGRKRRQRDTLPSQEEQDARIAQIEAAEKKERDRAYGLNVFDAPAPPTDMEGVIEKPEPEIQREKTADERAMDALLGIKQESSLVVPAISEEDAFQQDARSAPDGPSLDDYARVPVEEYGAAMLRGMGWKGGKAKVTKAPERRPAMLGIGAKSDAAITGELGGWGKAARGKDAVIYNPVMLKDSKTGELFTDAELQKKQEQDQRQKYEEEFEKQEKDKERRRRKHDDEDRRSSEYRRRDRSRDDRHRSNGDRYNDKYRSGRDRSSDRQRSGRDRDNHRSGRDRSRDRRYDSDDRRQRDRSRDRHRDHRDRH